MDPGISFYCANRKGYLPQPPREWSRVQNSCSVITPTDDTGLFQVPYSKKVLPYAELGPTLAMISKGNVLQYKKNSSNLTQWQKYSKIAKGQWVNRTKTWATQSDRGYTNPNNLNLIRVGGVNVTLNGTATTLPVTCPKPGTIVYPVLPANSGGGGEPNPVLPPPPIAPVDGGNVIPIAPVPVPEPIVIQDFGNLVCGTYENICTGERTPIILLDNCHPTTDSDVPGPIEELCWNDGNPTWYPRQRYIMTNSDNKWPVNAILGSADQFAAPALSASVFCNVITLSWTFDPFYSSYNIYQDEYTLPIGVVNGTTNTFTVTINNPEPPGTYNFYIRGVNGNIRSEASNTVLATIDPPPPPVLSVTTNCNVATLTWTDTSPCNLTYQVYENGLLIDTTNLTTLNINLDTVGTYTFYVIALFGSIPSALSVPVSVPIVPPSAPTLFVTETCNVAALSWTAPGSCTYTYQVYQDSGTGFNIIATTNNITNLNNIVLDAVGTYTFYVIAILGSIPSIPSIPVSVPIVPPSAPTLSVITTCNVAALSWTAPGSCNYTYQVYQDNVLIYTTNLTNLNNIVLDAVGTYTFYVIAILGSIPSIPSIPVSVPIVPPSAPTNLTYATACNKATLNWIAPGSCNYTYEVYKDGVLIGTTNNITTLGNITLVQNVTYQFYVIAVLGSIPSLPSTSVSITFVEYAQTGGLEYNYNPLSGDTNPTGYTYILFNTIGTSFTFYSGCIIDELYYMIVGPGGNAQSGFVDTYYSVGGVGGGAGGIWNGLTSLPQGNYTITIPNVDDISSTIIQDSTNPVNFNIIATTGSFILRGGVSLNGSTLSPTSTTNGEFGVGGLPSKTTQASGSSGGPFIATSGTVGGSVYLGTSNIGNYINFVGDNKLSNKLFGGGGGGGGRGGSYASGGSPAYPPTTGYNGGGGGGGGGEGLNGGTGTNGANGNANAGAGGNAFTNFTTTPGYGGGGGGGGSITIDGTGPFPKGPGGSGGPAMLMIYFIKKF
jgi:hypothetical protein